MDVEILKSTFSMANTQYSCILMNELVLGMDLKLIIKYLKMFSITHNMLFYLLLNFFLLKFTCKVFFYFTESFEKENHA